jgi:hypothetical protein
MQRRRRLMWIVIAAIPIGILLKMWLVTGGLPYNTDSNESFSAYVQGQSMLHFNPWANAFLPDDATGYHAESHPFTYTHGPNLPRYFSALMYLLGVHNIEGQILISAVVSVLLSLWFIARSFPEPLEPDRVANGITLGVVIGMMFAVDFIGVLQFLGNLWRTWHFPLFWGCIWASRTRPSGFAGFVLFFLVFQLEFLFAIFTATTTLIYLVWMHRYAWRELFAARYVALAAGAVASVLFFVGQLVAFYGWSGFLFDLRTTYVARNSNQVSWEAIRGFYESHAVMMWPSSPDWDFRFSKYLTITWENMSLRLSAVIAAAVLASLFLSVALAVIAWSNRRSGRADRLASSVNVSAGPLLWAMVVAYLFLGGTIPGYALNGYTYRWAPLLVFPVSLALALLVGNAAALLSAARGASAVGFARGRETMIAVVPILTTWSGISLFQYAKYPDFVHTPATVLGSTYKGHSFVSATTFPHMIAHYTGRWAYYAPKLTFPGTERLDQTNNWNADRNRNPDYETPEYYLCEKLPYSGNLDCSDVGRQMEALGHTVVDRGSGYVVLKLNWHIPTRADSTVIQPPAASN